MEAVNWHEQVGCASGKTKWYLGVKVKGRVKDSTDTVTLDVSLPVRCRWGDREGIWAALARDEANYKSRPMLLLQGVQGEGETWHMPSLSIANIKALGG